MTWNEAWHNVVWSEEKKFNLYGPDDFFRTIDTISVKKKRFFQLVLKTVVAL